MIENLAHKTDIVTIVTDSEALFIANLNHTLRSNAFSNRMLIAPRRLSAMAQEEFAHVHEFLKTRDYKEAATHGYELAFAGLGHSAVIGSVRL